MPTLYVENVPKPLYEALRRQAKAQGKSMAAEVIEILKQQVPTAAARARQSAALERLLEIGRQPPPGPGPFPTTEEMLREDRNR